MDSVGVVGVGAMGSVFVERFRTAGLETMVYDVSDTAVQRAMALGASAAGSLLELAQSVAFVDIMVRTDAQMLDCVLGPEGALEGLHSGQVLLLHSSINPKTTREIAKAAASRGVKVRRHARKARTFRGTLRRDGARNVLACCHTWWLA